MRILMDAADKKDRDRKLITSKENATLKAELEKLKSESTKDESGS